MTTDQTSIFVELIGGGAGGKSGGYLVRGVAGGGGEYRAGTVPYVSGMVINVSVGKGGAHDSAGTDTMWDRTISNTRGNFFPVLKW
jgi:hypothetical protein